MIQHIVILMDNFRSLKIQASKGIDLEFRTQRRNAGLSFMITSHSLEHLATKLVKFLLD